MNKRLFVSNLAYSMTEEGLEQLFSRCGTVVNTKVVTDRDSGRSKGFGFVEMTSDAEAEEAIRLINEQEILGRVIRVNYARPLEEGRSGGDRGGERRFSSRPARPGGPTGQRRSFGGGGGRFGGR